jgi:hypothetical protein
MCEFLSSDVLTILIMALGVYYNALVRHGLSTCYSPFGHSCPMCLWWFESHEKENNSINAASYHKWSWMALIHGGGQWQAATAD